ncbi:pyridoxal phosphate-dependent decarboxylase family protein [Pseudoteredinibacter isoporae]|uniref:Glutamate/tyrosine decarboxylase-like PLP-dependent enzyme n=1 Tax=Pseudoteredinibacter isoporae TaxID=570281 RepID=A0A7X0MVT9_9GAMM|nr:aspartate aminotransferase family protein [Pseudoteredinibacter isoporae]MBB6522061.1 glutamate/tyrosine decarboxylase-like PLP-dependent enzyme [Pseudoteredinibacter isoporae]NHO87596.1 aspartate aminotransferase family protein [Pseudoteredinibacter isoporae]NIB24073.1 aspartate aminotransferase family protein [Pseudoteredinibacter isoporae]
MSDTSAFPQQGRDSDDLLAELKERQNKDLNWREGRVFSYVYDAGPEAMALLKDAFNMYLTENGLDPTTFPSAMELEKDVLRMAIELMNGGEEAEGTFTSGGTESLLLSVKTARDYARENKPEISLPELLLPETAHASFFKACHYFDVKPVVIPVDPVSFTADPVAMAEAVTANTIMMVASAPSYAHGVIDPIRELGEIALKHDLLFHVDCCVGGMYLPFANELGFDTGDFDLSVPGVTQISMDFHKLGYAAKGASAILYKHGQLMRRHQYFAWSGWSGYSVINPTVMSTKSAGPVAACWAIMNKLGKQGYLDLVQKTQSASEEIRSAIADIPQLKLLGDSKMNLLAFSSDKIDVFKLAERMKKRNWYIQPQFAFGASPANIHLTISHGNLAGFREFLSDLRACVAELDTDDAQTAMVDLPEEIAALFENPSPQLFSDLAAMFGGDGTEAPENMDEVNNLLNAMPHQIRDQLITEFVNRMFST